MKTISSKRFTLIELLVVIAIIVILAGLVFPALGTVRNNAKKSKASSECQGLKAAIVMYESEFSRWPVSDSEMKNSSDALVSDYLGMCKALIGDNSKKMVFYEVGVGYDDTKGILDPWGRPYEVALDFDYNNKLEESRIPAVREYNKFKGRSGNDLRSRVAVYSLGIPKEESASIVGKKMVTSW